MNPVIKHKFTADPTVVAHHDTVYLYTGHDEAPAGSSTYVMKDWLCFSSADLLNWKEHPSPLKATDFTWAKGDAYASKVIFHNNKFYWYAAVTHGAIDGEAIGVAHADRPVGPFTDARGTALITPLDTNGRNFDPTVLLDDDGRAYIFWGKQQCYYAELKKNMIELQSPIRAIQLPGFMEGAHIHKRNGWYYLSYGYNLPEKVAYVMSRSIHGPWEFKGILNEIAGNCETNRPAILDFQGKTYFFYHNGGLEKGDSHHRSVCIDALHYNEDDTMQRVIMTSEGISC